MPEAIKLNLGCGFKKYPGYINVDSAPQCMPDAAWDIERTPWPWQSNSVSEIKLEHVLEHVGTDSTTYLKIWREIWRVCRHGALVDITVPHWNHENFFHDPTHVRPITPVGIAMFDQARNMEMAESGIRETALGLISGVDLTLGADDISYTYAPKILEEIKTGRLSHKDAEHLREHQLNICIEVNIRPHIIKPARGAQWLAERGFAGSV